MPSYTVAQRACIFALENRCSALEKRIAELERPEKETVVLSVNIDVPDAGAFHTMVERRGPKMKLCDYCDRDYGEVHKPGCRRVTQTFGIAARDAHGNPWLGNYHP